MAESNQTHDHRNDLYSSLHQFSNPTQAEQSGVSNRFLEHADH